MFLRVFRLVAPSTRWQRAVRDAVPGGSALSAGRATLLPEPAGRTDMAETIKGAAVDAVMAAEGRWMMGDALEEAERSAGAPGRD